MQSFTFHLKEKQYEYLKKKKFEEDRNMSEIVRELIEEDMEVKND